MRVYLDNCCYNRSFDEQTQLKVRLTVDRGIRGGWKSQYDFGAKDPVTRMG